MEKADRIRLILQLADILEGRPYDDGDLVLRQFGVSWSETWEGTPRGYYIHHLEDATEEALEGIRAFLQPADVPSGSGEWDSRRFRLFISHSSLDKEAVADLKHALAQYGVDGFIAHQDLTPSSEWQSEILGRLGQCDALLAYLTAHFQPSDWTDHEVGYAIARKVLVLPVIVGVMPYGFLAAYQGLHAGQRQATELASEIVDLLMSREISGHAMRKAIVSAIADAKSFNHANKLADHIRKIAHWTPELLRELEASLQNNQVSGAWIAQRVVREILAANQTAP